MQPLFNIQPSKVTDCLDVTLLELIDQFSFNAFFDPFFGNGRLYSQLSWDKVHGSFISDNNKVLISFFWALKTNPRALFQSLLYKTNRSNYCDLIKFWEQQQTGVLDEDMLLSFCVWSNKLQGTNIINRYSIGLNMVKSTLTPDDLLFVQPNDKKEQQSFNSLLLELELEQYNWILVVPYNSNNVTTYKQYQQIITYCKQWLIVYNKGQGY